MFTTDPLSLDRTILNGLDRTILNGDPSTSASLQGQPWAGRAGDEPPGDHHLVTIWTFLNVNGDIFVFVIV